MPRASRLLLGFLRGCLGLWAIGLATTVCLAQSAPSDAASKGDPPRNENDAVADTLQKTWALLHKQQWKTAAQEAGKTIELARSQHGEVSTQHAEALELLARAKIGLRDPAGAEPYAKQAFEVYRQAEGEVTLTGLRCGLVLAHSLQDQQQWGRLAKHCVEQLIPAHDRLIPEPNATTQQLLSRMGLAFLRLKKGPRAERIYRMAVPLQQKLEPNNLVGLGFVHLRLADALNLQGKHDEAETLTRFCLKCYQTAAETDNSPDARMRIAGAYWNLGANLRENGRKSKNPDKLKESEACFLLSIKIRRELGVPEQDTGLLFAHKSLAHTFSAMGRKQEAVEKFRYIWKTNQKHRGPTHPDTLAALRELAEFHQDLPPFEEAERLLKLAIRLHRESSSDSEFHVIRLTTLLTRKLGHQERFAEALQLHHHLLNVIRERYGEWHRETATQYNNLGLTLSLQNKSAAAERMLRRSLEIREKLGHSNQLSTATVYHNLATTLAALGRLDEAIACSRQAVEIQRKNQGHPQSNLSLARNSLATILGRKGQDEEAAAIYESLVKEWGEKGGPVTVAMQNLGVTKLSMHQMTDADKLFQELYDLDPTSKTRSNVGGSVTRRLNLAFTRYFLGDLDTAIRLLQEADESYQAQRRARKLSGLDRAIATERDPNPVLATLLARQGSFVDAWRAWERSRAQGLLEEFSYRELNDLAPAERRRREDLLSEMRSLEEQLGAEKNEDKRNQLRIKLSKMQSQRFELEQRLFGAAMAVEPVTLRELQDTLPADAALVGWIESMPTHAPGLSDDHWAVVVRREGEPHWIRMPGSGPDGAWTKTDSGLYLDVIETTLIAKKTPAEQARYQNTIDRLRRQRIEPLRAYLKEIDGLPAAKHLIVVPNRATARLPLQAIAPEFTYGFAPSATVYVWLRRRGATRSQDAVSMLALADPSFGAPDSVRPAAGLVASPDDQWGNEVAMTLRGVIEEDSLDELPGTRREVAGIERAVRLRDGRIQLLLGPEATESELRRLNDRGELAKFRYLHFATHGLVNANEPLRSALALTVVDPKQPGTARLTAGEILSTWNLQADLVTLSACQTALGRFANGEGHIGFAQSLLVAGADSVLLSLWKVDDTATALLMQRFYQNLLGARPGLVSPLPKQDALREAQLWLRDLSSDEVKRLGDRLPQLERGTIRRERLPRDVVKTPDHDEKPYSEPYFWAGFILVGSTAE